MEFWIGWAILMACTVVVVAGVIGLAVVSVKVWDHFFPPKPWEDPWD